LKDPKVTDLALRVKCAADPDTAFPTYFSGGVAVTMRDGRVLKQHVKINSGAGERAMTAEAVAAKFMASAALTIPVSKAERIRDAVLDLEKIAVADLTALLRI
jgi:hypothetical protein